MDAMLLLKASLVLSATLLTARLLRRAPAASRHRLWTVAFAAVLALPLLASLLPAVYVPVPYCCGAPGAPELPSASTTTVAQTGKTRIIHETLVAPEFESVPSATPQAPWLTTIGVPGTDLRALLLTAWLAGTLAAASTLFVSLVRVRRLAGRSQELGDVSWRSSADALSARLGLRRPVRLFVSALVGTPMAGGVWRPAIFLPPAARDWGAERRDVVLAHELAHLAGHDPLRHLAARLAVACYWFHPLAWIAAREAAVAREQACDEAVLALGTRPSAYARILLELAESLEPSAAGAGALPMVDRSHMETRIMAILNDEVRPAATRRPFAPAIAIALMAVGLATAQPAVRAAGSLPLAALGPSAADATPPGPAAAPAASPRDREGRVPALQAAPVQLEVGRDSACWGADASGVGSFRGYSSTRQTGGRTIISEQVGARNFDRVIQKTFGDTRLCMLAEGAGDWSPTELPSQWVGRARRVVLEAQRRGVVQRLEVAGQRTSWQVGGMERAFDATAQQWRDRMLATLDTTWEISTLRGEVSSLAGEISSIRGQESSLRGEISSLQGEVSSMRGRQSSVRGDESSLRGQISSMRGHVSSLRGAISSEQGSISSLYASGYPAAQVSKHEKEIARLEQEIRDYVAEAKVAAVEREIRALDADGKVAAIETEIRAFDLDGKVAAIERQIAAFDVDGKIAAIERQITALDADRRTRQLEDRRDEELKRLEAALTAIR
jgi:beta-lactamase regulating signal transducer with metallopeptidase domain/predicted  nucleic acid-binding Zn-ribbon protein